MPSLPWRIVWGLTIIAAIAGTVWKCKPRPAPRPAAAVVDSVPVTDNALLIAATEMADDNGWLVFSVNHILPQHGGGVMLHFVKDTVEIRTKGEKK